MDIVNIDHSIIECNLNTLIHNPILETTKQHLIMNIDVQIDNKQLHTKLTKINKALNQVVQTSTKQSKLIITKGQMDTYKIIIESLIEKARKSGQLLYILGFNQNTPDLLNLLEEYKEKHQIQLQIVNIHQQLYIKSIIDQYVDSIKTEQVKLICFPMIDQIFGTLLLDQSLFSLQKDKCMYWYLDCIGGFPYLQQLVADIKIKHKKGFNFDFWSINSNQINGTHNSSLLMFNTSVISNLRNQTIVQPDQDNLKIQLYNSEIFAVQNSLNTFLCNRELKSKRLLSLNQSLIQGLKETQILCQLPKIPYGKKSISLQQLLLDALKKEYNKTPSKQLIVFTDQQNCIPSISIFCLMFKNGSKLQPVKRPVINHCLDKYQITLNQIDPQYIPFIDIVNDQNMLDSFIQISTSDLTFSYIIKQFVKAIETLNKTLIKS